MAPTPLTPVQVGHKTAATLPLATAGAALDAVNGNSIPNGGQTVLLVFNSGASDRTFTIAFGRTVDGQAVTPLGPFTVPAGTERAIKLGSPGDYGNPTLITGNNAELRARVLQV